MCSNHRSNRLVCNRKLEKEKRKKMETKINDKNKMQLKESR